jgi:metal-dependent amidase/aminoacylase/carboxypeptidase family protein
LVALGGRLGAATAAGTAAAPAGTRAASAPTAGTAFLHAAALTLDALGQVVGQRLVSPCEGGSSAFASSDGGTASPTLADRR